MQQTRLNSIFDIIGNRLERLFANPWRRIALLLISLLFGIFMGSAISTTTGQAAGWDVIVAAILLLIVETVSRIVYTFRAKLSNKDSKRRRLLFDVLNLFKTGIVYSLFLEAFKLGS
jgi:uncharacterized membrane protein